MTFEEYYNQFHIPYFSASEMLCKGSGHWSSKHKGYMLNTDPPRSLWGNVIHTAKVASLARGEVGPIKVTSAYRSPEYNNAVGGATNSLHGQFNALDLIPVGVTPRELHSTLLRLRNEGRFIGGLGLYNTFVHLDTRGYNADW